jgi:hypothetical protein
METSTGRRTQKLLPITGLWVRIPPPAPIGNSKGIAAYFATNLRSRFVPPFRQNRYAYEPELLPIGDRCARYYRDCYAIADMQRTVGEIALSLNSRELEAGQRWLHLTLQGCRGAPHLALWYTCATRDLCNLPTVSNSSDLGGRYISQCAASVVLDSALLFLARVTQDQPARRVRRWGSPAPAGSRCICRRRPERSCCDAPHAHH